MSELRQRTAGGKPDTEDQVEILQIICVTSTRIHEFHGVSKLKVENVDGWRKRTSNVYKEQSK